MRRTSIAKLALWIKWIDIPREGFEQHFVFDFGGVVGDLHRFGMAGAATGNFAAGGIFLGAAREAGDTWKPCH
jgi:hypothetical protein